MIGSTMNTYEMTVMWMGNWQDSKEFKTATIQAESTREALKQLIPNVPSHHWFE